MADCTLPHHRNILDHDELTRSPLKTLKEGQGDQGEGKELGGAHLIAVLRRPKSFDEHRGSNSINAFCKGRPLDAQPPLRVYQDHKGPYEAIQGFGPQGPHNALKRPLIFAHLCWGLPTA